MRQGSSSKRRRERRPINQSKGATMSRKDNQTKVDRRKFLAGVAVGAAGVATTNPAAAATSATSATGMPPRPSALPPTAAMAAAETGTSMALPHVKGPAGSDFMVDVIKTLDIEYV